MAEQNPTAATTGAPYTTVSISVHYVKDSREFEEGTDDYHLVRDLRTFGTDYTDHSDVPLDEAFQTAYKTVVDERHVEVDGNKAPREIAEQVFRRMQGGRWDPELGYHGGKMRSLSVGDIVVIDGTALMVAKLGFQQVAIEEAD